MGQSLKFLLDSRNYREVAGLWLVGSMFGAAAGLFFGIVVYWIAGSPGGAGVGVAACLYVAGLIAGPWLGWRLHERGKYGLAMLAGLVPAPTCVVGLMWMTRFAVELA